MDRTSFICPVVHRTRERTVKTQVYRETTRLGFGSHEVKEYMVEASNGRVRLFQRRMTKNTTKDDLLILLGISAMCYLVVNTATWALSDDPKEETFGASVSSYFNHVAGNTRNIGRLVFGGGEEDPLEMAKE